MLLGENYYTDRTSKQTVDFLKRRDKTLQSQIHSLKAEIEDFQTEASFFTTTASEAAVGLFKRVDHMLILSALSFFSFLIVHMQFKRCCHFL